MDVVKQILVDLGWIWGPLVAIGAVIDIFTVGIRGKIHDRVGDAWLSLSDTSLPNIPAKLCVYPIVA